VWWRLDDGTQGSKTFGSRTLARDFKNELLARPPQRLDRPAPRPHPVRSLGRPLVVAALVRSPRWLAGQVVIGD
jgi:hypothetical protein